MGPSPSRGEGIVWIEIQLSISVGQYFSLDENGYSVFEE
jgi:hypothetical protein